MLANDAKYLYSPSEIKDLVLPRIGIENIKTGEAIPKTDEALRDAYRKGIYMQEWEIPRPGGRPVWTDDFSNIISILNIRH